MIAFERYRSTPLERLDAALSESQQLTEQLITQQAELGKANRALAVDYAVTRALAEAATPAEAGPLILQTICITTGWEAGAIWDVNPQAGAAHCISIWPKPVGGPAVSGASSRGHMLLRSAGLHGNAPPSREPRWVTEIVKSGNFFRLHAAEEGPRSEFVFPILIGGEVIGVLNLYSREIRQPEPEMIQIMAFIGSHIGQLIQRGRAEEALLKSKEERLVELERVRKRIAADLHDDIGSSLTKIALLSEAVRQNVSEKSGGDCEPMAAITTISNELVEAMSDIVWAINPQKDYLRDLSQRMRRFASDIFIASRISFRFRAPGPERDMQMGANIRREVFLIFKESINNVVKHSECSEVVIDLSVEDGWLILAVSDDGRGFDPALVKADTGYLSSRLRGGNGLASMRRRARELGGQFEVVTSIGRGTTVALRLPLVPGPSGSEQGGRPCGW
jgi:signal transduction histidine kinase